MALPTTVTYSTWEEFKAHTPVSTQTTISEGDWKRFALRGEAIVDSYTYTRPTERYETDQVLMFPIKDSDGNSLIPDAVSRAHIEITSDLVFKGDPTAENGTIETGEAWSSSSYSKSKSKKVSSSSDATRIEMPALARRLLQPWTDVVSQITY